MDMPKYMVFWLYLVNPQKQFLASRAFAVNSFIQYAERWAMGD